MYASYMDEPFFDSGLPPPPFESPPPGLFEPSPPPPSPRRTPHKNGLSTRKMDRRTRPTPVVYLSTTTRQQQPHRPPKTVPKSTRRQHEQNERPPRKHSGYYHNDSSMKRVFQNQDLSSPNAAHAKPSEGRFTFTMNGQLYSDVVYHRRRQKQQIHHHQYDRKKTPKEKNKPGPRSRKRIHLGAMNVQGLRRRDKWPE